MTSKLAYSCPNRASKWPDQGRSWSSCSLALVKYFIEPHCRRSEVPVRGSCTRQVTTLQLPTNPTTKGLQAVSLSLSPSLKCLAGQQSRPCPLVAPVRTICQKKLQQAAHQGFKGIEFFYEDLETFAAQSSGDASRLNILKGALRIRHLCTSLQLEIIALQPFWFYEGVLDEAEHNRLIDDKLRFWFEICHILHTDMILTRPIFSLQTLRPANPGLPATGE